ncbi:MAG: FAD-dependent thymidylate synthase [Oceanobacillus sp.]|nr:FAD-dependent thymidylate synthase [Oceanobacillus sp.]
MSNTKQEEKNTEVEVKEEINNSNKTSTVEKRNTTRKRPTKTESSENKQTEKTIDISPFVSNPEGNIYAIKNLPEEFVATLFAWVSRSPKSFKEHLQIALKEFDIEVPKQDTFTSLDKKAKDFHEKWTVGYGHSCYDEKTEVLTEKGFKNWFSVNDDDKLASVNPDSLEVEYLKPVKLIEEPYTGPMYKVDRNRIDMMVTPNHKVFAWPRHKIKEFETRKYQLINAEDLKDKCYKVRLGGLNWNGDVSDTLYGYPIEPLLQLFGFFIGDGYIDTRTKHSVQFHIKKQRKIDYLYSLCEQLGLSISANKNYKFYITSNNNDIGDILSKCYDENREKQIPDNLLELDSTILHYLFDGLMNSDGSKDHRNGSMVYDTSSKTLADQVQHLVLLLGWSSYLSYERPAQSENHKDGWRLFITKKLLESMVNKVQYDIFDDWEDYSGLVYCAELPKYHTLIVRRNGRVHISGNSVAEHAVAHVGIENVSRLASADLELSNTFYSITEYSQRYQKPKRGDWHNPFKKNSKEHKEFEQSMNECFDSFEKLIDGVLKDLCQKEGIPFKTEKTETVEIIRKRKALEKLAFEDARYVLPLAMYTQLGMTANGRAWRDGLAKLETSKYTEVQDMRKALKEEITKVLPVLLKYADASPYQKKHQSVIESNFNSTQDDQALQRDVKVLIVSLERLEVLNILALYYVQQSNIPYSVALNRARELDYEKRNQIIEQLLFDMKHFDTAPEAFKSVNYQVELKVSEANWHQLLRHNRKTDFIFAGPSMQNGLVIPPRIKAAGLEHLLVNLHENVFAQYVSFVEKGFDQEADYLVLNAHKRRVVANFDLMEVYHLINLRTSDEAQWDIKNTFNELYDVLSQYHPHLMKQAKRRI